MENIEKSYTGRNIYILADSQAAIKALDNFHINSKLVRGFHQSLVKLAEHNRLQLVWVPGHMGIDGNERADQLARQGSSLPLKGHEPALCISAKVVRGVNGGWTGSIHEYWQSIHGRRQAKGFPKRRPC
jgi:hypothetical protein